MPSKPGKGSNERPTVCARTAPSKDAEAHHHSVSEERKADCPECIDRAVYA
jgi:hypothetical protein